MPSRASNLLSKQSGTRDLASTGKPQIVSKQLLQAMVFDTEFELKMQNTVNNFYAEQESALKKEHLAISEKTQALNDDILAMKKQIDDIKIKTNTVESILEREQELTDQYSSKIGIHKESIASARKYIENLKSRRARVEDDKRAKDMELAETHKHMISSIQASRSKLADLQTVIERTQEERDELWSRFQAKATVQRQSDVESRLGLRKMTSSWKISELRSNLRKRIKAKRLWRWSKRIVSSSLCCVI